MAFFVAAKQLSVSQFNMNVIYAIVVLTFEESYMRNAAVRIDPLLGFAPSQVSYPF